MEHKPALFETWSLFINPLPLLGAGEFTSTRDAVPPPETFCILGVKYLAGGIPDEIEAVYCPGAAGAVVICSRAGPGPG